MIGNKIFLWLQFLYQYFTATLITILIVFMAQGAAAQPDNSKWQFSITPYFWLPNIEGTLNFELPSGSNASPTVDVGPVDYLEHLDFALMLSGEVRKKRWSVFTDLIYLDFSGEPSTVKSVQFAVSSQSPVEIGTDLDVGTVASLKGIEWTLAVGYSLIQTKYATLDLFGGLRYFDIEASVDWNLSVAIDGPLPGQVFAQSGNISQSTDLWDGIVGARGRINIENSNWFFPYRLDIGTGSSEFTWQGLLGVGYASKWGDIKLAYRHLYYDTDGKLIDDMSFSGPAFGWAFWF